MRLQKALSAAVVVGLTLVGCAASRQAGPSLHGDGGERDARVTLVQQSSADWAHFTVDGKSVLVNNVWNKGGAKGPYEQTIFEERTDGASTMGWKWKWPSTSAPVVAYPEIVYGEKPWDAPRNLVADFPFHPGAKTMVVDYDITLEATGVYNLAFEVWPVSALPGNKDTIASEVMFWIAHAGQTLAPAGHVEGTIDVGGTTFDMYVNRNHSDASGANANTWPYIAFAARTAVLKGPLDFGAFFDYLMQKGLLKQDQWITGIELGNEIQTGTGVTRVRNFAVTIK